jgi:hypothetical protein
MNSEVSKLATQTFMGQKMFKPVIDPIPYNTQVKPIRKQTVEEFKLDKKEIR